MTHRERDKFIHLKRYIKHLNFFYRIRPMEFSQLRPLKIFMAVASLLTVAALGSAWFAGHVLHFGFPYDNVLLPSRAYDLNVYSELMTRVHSYRFFASDAVPYYAYPAPVAPLYVFFLALPHHTVAFEAFIVLSVIFCAILFSLSMMRRDLSGRMTLLFLGVSIATAYPVWFEFRQANMEICVFLLVAFAIWMFLRGQSTTAAICVGIAASMKLYPVIFLGLFLARRQYKPVVIATVTSIIVTLASLAFLTPSIKYSWHGVGDGLNLYRRMTIEGIIPAGIGYDHSIFALIKRMIAHTGTGLTHISLILNAYLLFATVCGVFLYFIRIRFLPIINQVLIFTLAAVFVSPSSFNYTLINLYVPWAMLVLFVVKSEGVPGNIEGLSAAFFCFAILLSAQTEFIFHQRSIDGQIKAVVSLFLMFIALRYPFEMENPPEDNPLRLGRARASGEDDGGHLKSFGQRVAL
jgi:hypothetical protein